jgi:hypothetical protein
MWKRTACARISVFVYGFMYPDVKVDKIMCIHLKVRVLSSEMDPAESRLIR